MFDITREGTGWSKTTQKLLQNYSNAELRWKWLNNWQTYWYNTPNIDSAVMPLGSTTTNDVDVILLLINIFKWILFANKTNTQHITDRYHRLRWMGWIWKIEPEIEKTQYNTKNVCKYQPVWFQYFTMEYLSLIQNKPQDHGCK